MLSDGPLSTCLSCMSVCNIGVLWPNGCTDHDETWHADRPRPWPYCFRWGTRFPFPPEGAQSPIFGLYLLQPNCCMDQGVTWYGGRPRPDDIVLDGDPASPPQKGGRASPPIFGPCLLWPNGWMDQDATWYGGRP